MKKVLIILVLGMFIQKAHAQFGYGAVVYWDAYSRYLNPSDDIANRSAGSAVANLGIGPKLWVGGKGVSLSVEATANLGILGLSTKDYKGLGIVSFPLLAQLNFGGSSSFSNSGKLGFSIGGGLQYNKTELYYLSQEYKDKGVTRDFFTTYIGQVGVGFGLNGVVINGFFRYGFHPDSDARTYNMGLQFDLNVFSIKKIDRPESELL